MSTKKIAHRLQSVGGNAARLVRAALADLILHHNRSARQQVVCHV